MAPSSFWRRFAALFVTLSLLTSIAPFSGFASEIPEKPLPSGIKPYSAPQGDFVEGEVLVKFKREQINVSRFLGRLEMNSFAASNRLERKETFEPQNMLLMKTREKETTKQLVQKLKKDPRVEYVEPNFIRHLDAIPNDPDFSQLWGLHNTGQTVLGAVGTNDADIDAPEAWDIFSGGTDVIVAVLDTGIAYHHPDLANNMWEGSSSCKDESGNIISGGCPHHGWDFVNDDNDPADDHGHGTHVAGTIGAQGNNGQGVAGVNWTTSIMAVKVGDANGFLFSSDWIRGLNFAKYNGAKVVNASFGGGGFSFAEYEAIQSFPGLFIAAAGNSSSNNDPASVGSSFSVLDSLNQMRRQLDTVSSSPAPAPGPVPTPPSGPRYPSGYDLPNIIAVASSESGDLLSGFSNFGPTSVDVAAPGSNIYSTSSRLVYEFDIIDLLFSEDFEDTTPPSLGDSFSNSSPDDAWETLSLSGNVVATGDVDGFLTGSYANNRDATIESVPVDLSEGEDLYLVYDYSCDTERYFDFMYVSLWNGTSFQTVRTYHGTSSGNEGISLEGFDVSDFKVRFRWYADYIVNNYDGCWIDNVHIGTLSSLSVNGSYEFKSGTSMATPHVAGEAALLWSYNPTLTSAHVRTIIESTVDPLSSLAGKVKTGGRINLANALNVFQPELQFGEVTQSPDGDGLVTVRFKLKDGIAGLPITFSQYFGYSIDGGPPYQEFDGDSGAMSPNWRNNNYRSSLDFSDPEYSFTINTRHPDFPDLNNADRDSVVFVFDIHDGVVGAREVRVFETPVIHIDNVPPVADFSTLPISPATVRDFEISVSGAEVVSYQYNLMKNSHVVIPLSSDIPVATPISLTGLQDGFYDLNVFGKDAFGNVQGKATVASWIVDVSGPTGSIIVASGTPTNRETPTFALTIQDEGVGPEGAMMRFSCDATMWTDFEPFQVQKTDFNIVSGNNGCSAEAGPVTRTVFVQYQDSIQNLGSLISTTLFIFDPTANLAEFTNVPALLLGYSNVRSPSFTVGGMNIVRYQYRLDNGTVGFSVPLSTVAPVPLQNLADGQHVLEVFGIDDDGNTLQTTPTSFIWSVDTIGPVMEIAHDQTSLTNDTTPDLELAIFDSGVGFFGAVMRLSCDGQVWSEYEPVRTAVNDFDIHSGQAGCSSFDGQRTVYVQGRDILGNESLISSTATPISIDTTPPQIDGLQDSGTPAQSVIWNWSSPDPDATFRFLVSQSRTADLSSLPYEYEGVMTASQHGGEGVDGIFYLHVQSRDPLGNESAVLMVSALLDNTAPIAEFVAPLPHNPTRLASASIQVEGTDVVEYRLALDAGAFGPVTSVAQLISLAALADGDHTLLIVGRDSAGNEQAEAAATSFNWIVESTIPVVLLSTLPTNPTFATSTDITVGGQDVAFYRYRFDDGVLSAETSVSQPIVLSDLTLVPHKLVVIGRRIEANATFASETEGTVYEWTVEGGRTRNSRDRIELENLRQNCSQQNGTFDETTRLCTLPSPAPVTSSGGGGGGGFIPAPAPSPSVPPEVLGEEIQRFQDGMILKSKEKQVYYLVQDGNRVRISATLFREEYSESPLLEVDDDVITDLPLLKSEPPKPSESEDEAPRALFSDVALDHEYRTAIESLVQQGSLKGFSDGTFLPDRFADRAEFVSLFVKMFFPGEQKGFGNCFTDVTDQWFAESVCFAKSKGWVNGNADGKFNPTGGMEIAAAYKIMLEALVGGEKIPPADGLWFEKYLAYARSHDLLHRSEFTPWNFINRGEMAQMMWLFSQR